jgi:hypothetical protein
MSAILTRQARDNQPQEEKGGKSSTELMAISFFECFPYVCPEPVLVKCCCIFSIKLHRKKRRFPHLLQEFASIITSVTGAKPPQEHVDTVRDNLPLFAMPLCDYKTITLPRQARDKHRKR